MKKIHSNKFNALFSILIIFSMSACDKKNEQKIINSDIKKWSIQQLESASKEGDSKAKIELGIKYLEGKEVDKNIEEGIKLLEQAANAGNAKAMHKLYEVYLTDSYGVSSDEKSKSWLRKAAETGDAEYQYLYASRNCFFSDGKIRFWSKEEHREEDMSDFIEWIKRAAANKYPQAMFEYGIALLSGLTNESDKKPGTSFAGSGSIKTLLEQNSKLGIDLLRESADKGYWQSQWALAVIYQSGMNETPPNKELSDKYWGMLKQLDKPEDLRHFANKYSVYSKEFYKDGKNKFEGKSLSYEQSLNVYFELIKKAADLGDVDAMVSVAESYETGKGVYKNLENAITYFKKAADKGSYSAQASLGYAYYQGEGVLKDFELAKSWLLKSVSEPNPNKWFSKAGWAQNLLGVMNEFGMGGDSDYVIAYAWYNLSASNGFEKAKSNLSRVEKNLNKDDLREAQQLSRQWKLGQDISRTQAISKDRGSNVSAGAGKLSNVGTGFFIDNNGLLITNNHVVINCKEIKLPSINSSGKLIVADAVNDIALIKYDTKVSDYLKFVSTDSIKQGEDVFAFGFPLDGYLPNSGNITQGIISALSGPSNNSSLIQITAPVQPGNSGGPLLNKKGLVIGQVVGKADAIRIAKVTGDIPQNVNFAISESTIKAFLKANNQKFDESSGTFVMSKSTVEIAEIAKKSSAKVECWK